MNWIERAQEYGHWAITRVGDKPNLHEANLHGANLRGADLREATGFHPLVHTDHGYRVDASWRGREWRIVAGCRDFSVSEARAHWGDPDYHTYLLRARLAGDAADAGHRRWGDEAMTNATLQSILRDVEPELLTGYVPCCAQCGKALTGELDVELDSGPTTCLRCALSVLMALADADTSGIDGLTHTSEYDSRRLADALNAHSRRRPLVPVRIRPLLRRGAAVAVRGAHNVLHRVLERFGVRVCWCRHLTGNRYRPMSHR